MAHYLYKITNKVNGKLYIGITKNPKSRKNQHLNTRNRNWNSLISKAIDKYGKESFVFEVLCVGSREYISDLERLTITAFGSLCPKGYNIQLGGFTGSSGYKMKTRVSDRHLFVKGFWFPSLRVCAEKLNVDKTTVLAWKKEGNAGNTIRPRKLKQTSLEKPCYVGGFWFPLLSQAVCSLGISRSTLAKRIAAGYIEQQNIKSSVRGEAHPNTVPVEIHGVVYSSITEAAILTEYTYRVIWYRLKNNKQGFSFVE